MLLAIVNEGVSISDERVCLLILYQRRQSSRIIVQVVNNNRQFIIPQSPRSARRNRPKLACGLATEPLDGGASGRFVRAGVLALPGLPVIQTRQVARAVCDLRSSLSTNAPPNFPSHPIHLPKLSLLPHFTSTSNSYLYQPLSPSTKTQHRQYGQSRCGVPQHSH